jgi:uncharacterized membrane protein
MTGVPSGEPSTTGLAPNIASALSYLAGPFSGVLVLLAERTNPTVRFHAWQSVIGLGGLGVLVAALILGAFAAIVVSAALFRALLYVGWVVWIGWIVLWVVCIVKAYQGRRWKLPLAGDYAERFI